MAERRLHWQNTRFTPPENPDMPPRDYPLEPYWMPFTANRAYKAAPRLLVGAKDMHYLTEDGRQVLDGTSGLWCVNAGHCRPKIVEAIRRQAGEMDYSPAFQMGHPGAFRVAERVAKLAPGDLDRVFSSEYNRDLREARALLG